LKSGFLPGDFSLAITLTFHPEKPDTAASASGDGLLNDGVERIDGAVAKSHGMIFLNKNAK
jgi:hypothetical protein